MNTAQIPLQEWVKLLQKGMITIPKPWRDALKVKQGDVLRAEKQGDRIVLSPMQKNAPYRVYSKKELELMLQDDRL